MGYSSLHYEDYLSHLDYWYSELGLMPPAWAEELSGKGYRSVSAIDFYDDLFGEDLEEDRMPEDYRTGEYAAIAIELVPDGLNKKGKEKFKARRFLVTKGQPELYDLIDRSENFCMVSALSYAGRNRTNENARFLYALVIEIDDIVPNTGLDELIYSWQRKNLTMPQPTYIVCSGNGLHLYFVFERPIPMYSFIFEQFSAAKTDLTRRFWNSYVTTSHQDEDIQFESVNQAFRCVGTMGKDKTKCAMAFQIGPKITVEYLNKFLPDQLKITEIYKSKLSLNDAKERYPKWYQRRIVEGKGRGHWTRHEGIYHNWIEKTKQGTRVGKRYNCLENLCSLAVQCNISPEQVEKDCRDLAEFLETLTISPDNHFTEYDVICALRTYHNADEGAYNRRVEYVSNRTGIPLQPAKRNGQKQSDHLEEARAIRDIRMRRQGRDWREGNGRPEGSGEKQQQVLEWRAAHPEGSKAECNRQTGLDPKTIRKWWDSALTDV